MENTENKNQELQEFAREMKNEMAALLDKTMNEMRYSFENVMCKQVDMMEHNMSRFNGLMTVMFDKQQKQMEELKNSLEVVLHSQSAMFEHYLMVLRETNEKWYEEMKVLGLNIVDNLNNLNAESTKHE